MMEKIGVMVCGHGSRDEGAVSEFEAVARGIRARLPQYPVESGFLEFATPIIREGLDKLRAGGVTRCLAVRSEEHTSELQSLMRISYAVFCLKKKKPKQRNS